MKAFFTIVVALMPFIGSSQNATILHPTNNSVNSTSTAIQHTNSDGEVNGHPYVDLGLPSGTKWAVCNMGASTCEKPGDFYAWGEVSSKSNFSDLNSLMSEKNIANISGNPKYDAATANWGEGWCLPTAEDVKELHRNCSIKWTAVNGVRGYLFTSNKNRKQIFLAVGGACEAQKPYWTTSWGYYWTGTQFKDAKVRAVNIDFNKNYFGYSTGCAKSLGLKIRPVLK